MYGKAAMEYLEKEIIEPPLTVGPLPTVGYEVTVDGTLSERGNRYGKFSGHARIAQQLKLVMHNTSNWDNVLKDSQRESLDMIAHKIGRILNGDPSYADSWHDIAGYASLIDKQLTGEDL